MEDVFKFSHQRFHAFPIKLKHTAICYWCLAVTFTTMSQTTPGDESFQRSKCKAVLGWKPYFTNIISAEVGRIPVAFPSYIRPRR